VSSIGHAAGLLKGNPERSRQSIRQPAANRATRSILDWNCTFAQYFVVAFERAVSERAALALECVINAQRNAVPRIEIALARMADRIVRRPLAIQPMAAEDCDGFDVRHHDAGADVGCFTTA
jgi:hypothetical protein